MAVKPVTPDGGPVDMNGARRFPCGRGSGFINLHGVYDKVFGKDNFFVIAYGAYDALGLIGHEQNGIAIAWGNKGVLLIDEHLRRYPNPTGRAGPEQVAEYARICGLGRDEFRDFVNNYPGVKYKVLVAAPRPLAEAPEPDRASFAATPFATAEEKARGLRALLLFVVSGFDRLKWSKSIYKMLHMHFGHTAHYDMGGFYEAQFGAIDDQIEFLERHRNEAIRGTPEQTWCDARRFFREWLKGEGEPVVAALKRKRDDGNRAREPARPAPLKTEHPEATGS